MGHAVHADYVRTNESRAYQRPKPKLHLVANFELNVNLSLDRIEGDSDDDVQVLGEREEDVQVLAEREEEVRMVGVVIALQPGERWIERE